MSPLRLVLRSLVHHWRAHAGILLGAVLSTGILVGALAVGDSVRHSLRRMALARLGSVRLALSSGERLFGERLARETLEDLGVPGAPILLLPGTATADAARANGVQVVGADSRFWELAPRRPGGPWDSGVLLNERLARELGAHPGQELVLRVDRPSRLSRDAPLSTTADASVALRLPVAGIVPDSSLGRFGLAATQVPPPNAFVPLRRLQEALDHPGRVNALLIGGKQADSLIPEAAARALWKRWRPEDSGLQIRTVSATGERELCTDRVFLEPAVGRAARQATPNARGVLAYFVNSISARGRATPYSLVAAVEGPPLPPGMRQDEIAVNSWLAADLDVRPGDTVRLTYWVAGPLRRLVQESAQFRVRVVLPIAGAAADRQLMPEIPGLADKANCRDWEPGLPIDLDRIRSKDEAYWSAYRGTPKAFLTLAAGQRIWNNRFGDLTAVRDPGKAGVLEASLKAALGPGDLGFVFEPVRARALAAGSQSMDFGQLFLGFSLFLIVAALLLAALLFALAAEARARETGTLLALGVPPRRVRRMILAEGALVALAAAPAGALAGFWYTRAVIAGLSSVWRGAVGGAALEAHVEPSTVLAGAAAGFGAALGALWLVARRQAAAPARVLLAGPALVDPRLPSGRYPGLAAPVLCAVLGLSLLAAAFAGSQAVAAGLFFGAGAILLAAALLLCRVVLRRAAAAPAHGRLRPTSLAVRGIGRRAGRSLAAIALLACGSFLVVAVGAGRHDPRADAGRRSSGTGGFAYYAESTLPIHHDLNTPAGLEEYGLQQQDLPGFRFVQMRLKEGDEASCLNLNRAQAPRILGVDPAALASRRAFSFARTAAPGGWNLLDRPLPDGAVPAVGDTNTVVWSLGKGLGDVLNYVDERGRARRLRIVGILGNCVLQGALLISERSFVDLFPSEGGSRVLLIDAPPGSQAAREELARALEDTGLSVVPAADRLALFGEVEATYLSIFAALGGLGLVLGSLGLGVVVLRNMLERRAELAILRAVGLRRRQVRGLVFREHAMLLLLGLGAGVAAGLVAVIPAVLSPGAGVPWSSLASTLAGVLASGWAWTWGASWLATRGPVLEALRTE